MPVTVSSLVPQFNTGASIFLELAFSDRNGAAVTPTAVSMQVNDASNGVVVQVNTSLTPPVGSTMEVPMPVAATKTTKPTPTQINTVIITATYPDGSFAVGTYSYQLNNAPLLQTTSPITP